MTKTFNSQSGRDLLRDPRRPYEKVEDDIARAQTDIDCSEEDSLTQQNFTQDADINVLAKRFGLDRGPIPMIIPDPNAYGDFTNAPDLRAALEIIRAVDEEFMKLDPKIRRRFENSPAKFWDFVHNPDMHDEGVKLGIFNPPKPPEETPKDQPKAGQ